MKDCVRICFNTFGSQYRLQDMAGGTPSQPSESGTVIADVPATDVTHCPQAPLPGALLEPALVEQRVSQTAPLTLCPPLGEPVSEPVFAEPTSPPFLHTGHFEQSPLNHAFTADATSR
ncbi:hypothetical protein HPB48_003441 [Haemaphysalis longicornis]|uniref:Uncharacterized protein n=1 Tax=Haemaphysalis longicornis TaxID=44386 RepID=A0A9J6G9R6_HAELO|nr:hypothetical protein HPB48_003441 [Haemaphysalis longicornis]